MTDRHRSYGLVAVPYFSGVRWTERARSADQDGWTSIPVPGTVWTPSPFPTLAAAAERARVAAGRPLPLILQLVGLAGRLPVWLARGGPDADTLLELRAALGIDEVVVPVDLAEFFVPVISRLTAA